MEWREGTFGGVLPEGAKARRVVEDTKTDVEYGERTWTTTQAVKDVFQNHLDANTEIFYERLTSAIIDIPELMERVKKHPKLLDLFEKFGYRLWQYRISLPDLTPEARAQSMRALQARATGLPLRREIAPDGYAIDPEAFTKTIEGIHEALPAIRYRVIDTQQKEEPRWVTLAELQEEKMRERPKHKKNFRYTFDAVAISDEGEGFDVKLSAFYKSTKRDKPYLRGKFGEGSKMSALNLTRHGVRIKTRSRYESQENGGVRERVWQTRPTVTEDATLAMRGVEVALPKKTGEPFGSRTFLTFADADSGARQDLVALLDPRREEGLAFCLDYASSRYRYPTAIANEALPLIGANERTRPSVQYVHGLRVAFDRAGGKEFLFSYDFVNTDVLQGRDRNEFIYPVVQEQINHFWKHAESAPLLRAFFDRVLRHTSVISPKHTLEAEAFHRFLFDKPEREQESRVRALMQSLLPRVLHLRKDRKNIFFAAGRMSRTEERKARQMTKEKKYEPIPVSMELSPELITALRQMLPDYDIATQEDLFQDVLVATPDTMKVSPDAIERVTDIFEDALEEARQTLQRYRPSMGDETSIQMQIARKSMAPLIDFFYDAGKRTYLVQINPHRMSDGEELHDYWKRRIVVVLLGLLGMTGDLEEHDALQRAQSIAQELLEKEIPPDAADYKAASVRFNHKDQPPVHFDSFFDTLVHENLERLEQSRALYEKIVRHDCSMEEMREAFEVLQAKSVHQKYAEQVGSMLARRVIVEGDDVQYCFPWYSSSPSDLVREKFSALQPFGKVNGHAVYRLRDGRLLVPQIIPDGSVIRDERSSRLTVLHKGELYAFEDHTFKGDGHLSDRNHGYHVGKNCLAFPSHDTKTFTATQKKYIEGVHILSPEGDAPKTLTMRSGTIETPLPVEYGKDEWNEYRVCQDIIQNHRDAGNVTLRFEVVRYVGGGKGRKPQWVSIDDVQPSDEIVGFMVSDDGAGYTPEGIGTLGRSSKKNPFFAGKYGEGQKLLAAAAVRSGLDLSFTSLGEYEGSLYRWHARPGTTDISYIVKGESVVDKRVVFHVTSEQEKKRAPYTSATVFQKGTASSGASWMWKNFTDIIDPRRVDALGRAGIARYFIDFREKKDLANVMTIGPVRVLLDEPGAVYENGVFVIERRESAVFGYDAPDVVKTRERNAVDSEKLNEYIWFAMTHCHGNRIPEGVLHRFNDAYARDIARRIPIRSDREIEDELSLLQYFHEFNPAYPAWLRASKKELGDYVVYSSEAVEEELKRGTQEEQIKASLTLRDIRHIRYGELLSINPDYYRGLRTIMPTATDYALRLAEAEVSASADTIAKLRRVVVASAGVLQRMWDRLVRGEETRETITRIITDAMSDRGPNSYMRLWSNKESLRRKTGSIFVAPSNAGYLGIVARDRIGFRQDILRFTPPGVLAGTARHELLHKIFNLRDYTPDFVMLLLELAKQK